MCKKDLSCIKVYCMVLVRQGFCRFTGLNYSEISGRQLDTQKTSEHLKEDIDFFFEDVRQQLEKYSLNLSNCNPFPFTAKDAC